MTFCDSIPEKLEDVIIHYPVIMMVAAICHLAERTDTQQTTANQKPGPYHNPLSQALI